MNQRIKNTTRKALRNILKPKRIKCKRCGYSWRTESRLARVTCPNCQTKVFLFDVLDDNERQERFCN